METFFKLYVLVILILYGGSTVIAQRNAEAEHVCKAFLTSRQTSPLFEKLDRNLTVDEDAEFECELVLQDRYLPAQIRLTVWRIFYRCSFFCGLACITYLICIKVHEGLFFLQLRHIQIGIDKYREILRHVRILREILPTSRKFAFYVARWASSPVISEFDEALDSLDCAFSGPCTEYSDDISSGEEYHFRRLYADLLYYSGRSDDALSQLIIAKNSSEKDFGASFAINDIARLTKKDPSISRALISDSAKLYEDISASGTNRYAGFRIPHENWHPNILSVCLENEGDNVLSLEMLKQYMQKRESFVTRATCGLANGLGWNTQFWTLSYLSQRLHNISVEVENTVSQESSRDGIEDTLGYSMGSFQKIMPFSEVFSQNMSFCSIKEEGEYGVCSQFPRKYRAINHFSSGREYSGILKELREDIPYPNILSDANINLTKVNMRVEPAEMNTRIRLHGDRTDSLYVLVSGKKRICLFSPDSAFRMKTLYPIISVSPSGYFYQYVPSGEHYTSDLNNMHFSSLKANDAVVRL